jgi:hypothetical protein
MFMPLTGDEKDHLNRMTSWMIGEIEACAKASINVGLATLVCCRIDALAGYLAGIDREKSVTEDQFVAFVKQFMLGFKAASREPDGTLKTLNVVVNRRSGERADQTYPEILYKHFRCGFVHEHLSKPGTGIVKDYPDHGVNPPYCLIDNRYGLVINIDRLREDFVAAVGAWKADVEMDGSDEQAAYKRRLAFIVA